MKTFKRRKPVANKEKLIMFTAMYSLATIATKALAELLSTNKHFNFRNNIISVIVPKIELTGDLSQVYFFYTLIYNIYMLGYSDSFKSGVILFLKMFVIIIAMVNASSVKHSSQGSPLIAVRVTLVICFHRLAWFALM